MKCTTAGKSFCNADFGGMVWYDWGGPFYLYLKLCAGLSMVQFVVLCTIKVWLTNPMLCCWCKSCVQQ